MGSGEEEGDGMHCLMTLAKRTIEISSVVSQGFGARGAAIGGGTLLSPFMNEHGSLLTCPFFAAALHGLSLFLRI